MIKDIIIMAALNLVIGAFTGFASTTAALAFATPDESFSSGLATVLIGAGMGALVCLVIRPLR